MKWKFVSLLLLLILFPLIVSKKHGEPRPDLWGHSESPFALISTFFWCRPNAMYKREQPKVYKNVRDALLEQEKWTTALLRDAEKPHDENVEVEMVLLAEEQKYRDWDPVWVRKVDLPEKSRIRIFLNEAIDSEISVYCRESNWPNARFHTAVAIEEFFYTPILVCKIGIPTCDMTPMIFVIPVVLSAIIFLLITLISKGMNESKEQIIAASGDRPGEYGSELDAYQARYAKIVDGRRLSWPEDEAMSEEFRIIPEPEGPFEDPFPMHPLIVLREESIRKPFSRYSGIYTC